VDDERSDVKRWLSYSANRWRQDAGQRVMSQPLANDRLEGGM
jgi:hypothetical protein